VIDRLLRVENLVVIPLLLIAVLVALGARWRDDPRRAGMARAITNLVRVGLALLIAGLVLIIALLVVAGPIGP
jgi:hypothetical protein